MRLRENGTIAPSDRTVVVSTAHGLKFVNSRCVPPRRSRTCGKCSTRRVREEDLGSVMDVIGKRLGTTGMW